MAYQDVVPDWYSKSETPVIPKAKFKLDRCGFDRSVGICYFNSIVKKADENKFDVDLIEFHDLEDNIKISRSKGKGKEKVLRFEHGSPKPYLAWELRLRATRSMKIYFNFNRYFFQENQMEHDFRFPVIHDDNYLPVNSHITTEDYVNVYKNKLPKEIISTYETWYEKLWPKEYHAIKEYDEDAVFKYVTLEVFREMYPLDVCSIKDDLDCKASKYSSYNGTTDTVYFGQEPDLEETYNIDNHVKLKTNHEPWRTTSNEFTMTSSGKIQCIKQAGRTDSTFNQKMPYEKIRQSKLYQKSIKLTRFEITLYDDQIDFNSSMPVQDIHFTLDEYMEGCGIVLKSFQEEYEEMITYIANLYKLDEATIYMLTRCGNNWVSTLSNKYLTNKLVRKKLLKKIMRGKYIINPAFLKMFKEYKPSQGTKKYLPKYL